MRPMAPQNPFVSLIDDKTKAYVCWDEVTQDIEHQPVTIAAYEVFRTTETNERNYTQVGTVNTTDAGGKIDTLFADLNLDPTKIYFYKIRAVNNLTEYSDYTLEVTDV